MLFYEAALRRELNARADRIEDVGMGNADNEKGAREVRGIVKKMRDA
jgi:hypothetical protein